MRPEHTQTRNEDTNFSKIVQSQQAKAEHWASLLIEHTREDTHQEDLDLFLECLFEGTILSQLITNTITQNTIPPFLSSEKIVSRIKNRYSNQWLSILFPEDNNQIGLLQLACLMQNQLLASVISLVLPIEEIIQHKGSKFLLEHLLELTTSSIIFSPHRMFLFSTLEQGIQWLEKLINSEETHKQLNTVEFATLLMEALTRSEQKAQVSMLFHICLQKNGAILLNSVFSLPSVKKILFGSKANPALQEQLLNALTTHIELGFSSEKITAIHALSYHNETSKSFLCNFIDTLLLHPKILNRSTYTTLLNALLQEPIDQTDQGISQCALAQLSTNPETSIWRFIAKGLEKDYADYTQKEKILQILLSKTMDGEAIPYILHYALQQKQVSEFLEDFLYDEDVRDALFKATYAERLSSVLFSVAYQPGPKKTMPLFCALALKKRDRLILKGIVDHPIVFNTLLTQHYNDIFKALLYPKTDTLKYFAKPILKTILLKFLFKPSFVKHLVESDYLNSFIKKLLKNRGGKHTLLFELSGSVAGVFMLQQLLKNENFLNVLIENELDKLMRALLSPVKTRSLTTTSLHNLSVDELGMKILAILFNNPNFVDALKTKYFNDFKNALHPTLKHAKRLSDTTLMLLTSKKMGRSLLEQCFAGTSYPITKVPKELQYAFSSFLLDVSHEIHSERSNSISSANPTKNQQLLTTPLAAHMAPLANQGALGRNKNSSNTTDTTDTADTADKRKRKLDEADLTKILDPEEMLNHDHQGNSASLAAQIAPKPSPKRKKRSGVSSDHTPTPTQTLRDPLTFSDKKRRLSAADLDNIFQENEPDAKRPKPSDDDALDADSRSGSRSGSASAPTSTPISDASLALGLFPCERSDDGEGRANTAPPNAKSEKSAFAPPSPSKKR